MKGNCVLYGVYVSIALICTYLEGFISLPFVTPGIKLGLVNIVILVVMYSPGVKAAFAVSITRVLLVGLLFGNGFTILYSLSGALCALFIMAFSQKTNCFSEIGISILGAVGHNIGQLLVAMAVLNTVNVVYYFVVLLVAAIITGTSIGVLAKKIIPRIKVIQERGVK